MIKNKEDRIFIKILGMVLIASFVVLSIIPGLYAGFLLKLLISVITVALIYQALFLPYDLIDIFQKNKPKKAAKVFYYLLLLVISAGVSCLEVYIVNDGIKDVDKFLAFAKSLICFLLVVFINKRAVRMLLRYSFLKTFLFFGIISIVGVSLILHWSTVFAFAVLILIGIFSFTDKKDAEEAQKAFDEYIKDMPEKKKNHDYLDDKGFSPEVKITREKFSGSGVDWRPEDPFQEPPQFFGQDDKEKK